MKKRGLSMALLGVFFASQVLAFPQPSHALASGCVPPCNLVYAFRIMAAGYKYAKCEIEISEALAEIFKPFDAPCGRVFF